MVIKNLKLANILIVISGIVLITTVVYSSFKPRKAGYSLEKYTTLESNYEDLLNEVKNIRNSNSELNMMVEMSESMIKQKNIAKRQIMFDKLTQQDYTTDQILNISTDTVKNLESKWKSCTINEPRLLKSLNSGSRKFVYLLDSKNKSSGSLFGLFNLNLSKNEKIAIIDYAEYKDTICNSDLVERKYPLRLAAGVRLTLKINNADKKVNLSVPSKVAAASEFGLAETTYTIETIGFKTKETRKILSDLSGNFNVDSYIDVLGAVGSVMKTMNDTMIVNPIELPLMNK